MYTYIYVYISPLSGCSLLYSSGTEYSLHTMQCLQDYVYKTQLSTPSRLCSAHKASLLKNSSHSSDSPEYI